MGLAAGWFLRPAWAIWNKLPRADVSQQRCLSPLPQHPTEVWFVFLTSATKRGLRSVWMGCWLAGQDHGAPFQHCPHMHHGGAPHPQQQGWTPAASRCIFSPGAAFTKHDLRQYAQLYFVNDVLQTRLFLSS